MIFDYFAGGAGDEVTLAEATPAWRRWRLRPKMLRDVAKVTTTTTLLGAEVETPIGIAPWAMQRMAHPDGEAATARGAAGAGALMTVSTSASISLEDIAAAAPGSPRWFQLYRVGSPAFTDDLVRRAAAAGYRALVLTVDLPYLGRRHRDDANAFALPEGVSMANHPPIASDDPYRERGLEFDATWTFDDIDHYAGLTDLPVIVKGVLRGDDARQCVNAGAKAVWVSTHGGRQVDQSVSSAEALGEIVEAVGPVCEVYADGGLRSPADVLTALSLGARGVFLGRPIVWALANGGADGVRDLLATFTSELSHLMGLCGVRSPAEITRDLVTR